jgi:hypothetical protein
LKTKKWQIEAKPTMAPGTCFALEGKSITSDLKTVLKGEFLIGRTKTQAKDQGRVQLKDPICFKSVQIGSKEIVTLDPHLKWAFSNHIHFITTSLFPISTNMDMRKQVNICLFISMKCILV